MRVYLPVTLIFMLFLSCSGVYKKEGASQVSPGEYARLLHETEDAYHLDIRTGMEFRKGHLEGFRNVNYLSVSFDRKIDSLDRDRPVFIYCQTAHRSPFVTRALLDRGFRRVIDLEGGYKRFRKWEADRGK